MPQPKCLECAIDVRLDTAQVFQENARRLEEMVLRNTDEVAGRLEGKP